MRKHYAAVISIHECVSQVCYQDASYSSLLISSLITRVRPIFVRQVAFVDLAGSERLKKTQVSRDDNELLLPNVYIPQSVHNAFSTLKDAAGSCCISGHESVGC